MQDMMNRREFMKLVGATSALFVSQARSSLGMPQNPSDGAPPKPGRPTRVFLAGVGRNPSEQTMKSAVRAAAEAATDFSWLSKGDSVFIKPALNSGSPYPATTNPMAIGTMVGAAQGERGGSGDCWGHVRHRPCKTLPGGTRGQFTPPDGSFRHGPGSPNRRRRDPFF